MDTFFPIGVSDVRDGVPEQCYIAGMSFDAGKRVMGAPFRSYTYHAGDSPEDWCFHGERSGKSIQPYEISDIALLSKYGPQVYDSKHIPIFKCSKS